MVNELQTVRDRAVRIEAAPERERRVSSHAGLGLIQKAARLTRLVSDAREQLAARKDPTQGFETAAVVLALIHGLLPGLSNPKVLELTIRLLLLVYRKHRMLGALGQGLIECIPEMSAPDAHGEDDAALWLESWQACAAQYTEFRLPLRLLDSAVRYRKTRDLRIFMNLPQEERALLEPLVGVHIEAIA